MIKRFIHHLLYSDRVVGYIRGMFGFKPLSVLLKRGLKVGDNLLIMNGVNIDPSHCWLITIGNNVVLSPFVHILAHDTSTKAYCGYTKIGKVNIGNNVFVGANSVILPGVSIGDNSIIGAGSVVSKPIPRNVVAAGNPCRVIQSLDEYKNKLEKAFVNSPHFNEAYTVRGNVSVKQKQEMRDSLDGSFGFVI